MMPADYHVHQPDESHSPGPRRTGGPAWGTVLVVLVIVAAVIALFVWLTTL